MSKIVSFKKESSLNSRKHNVVEVNCVYEVTCLTDGSPCVVLKTYNPSSKNAAVSQTLHITKEIAEQLIEILNKELNV